MKKTLHIDEQLLRDAKSACGARSDTDTVRLGLEALVRHGAYERLRALRGSEPHARETRRRRERASTANHATVCSSWLTLLYGFVSFPIDRRTRPNWTAF